MKRIISLFISSLLVFSLSFPVYAVTSDDLANKLYSGWTQTSSPTGFGSSWYSIVRQFLKSLDSNVSTIKTNSNSILSKLDSIINSYLHYIDSDTSNISTNSNSIVTALGSSSYGSVTYQMSQIRTLLTTISNSSSAWTSSQASTVTNNTSLINSVLSSISDKLIHIEPIYNNSVTIDSNVSDLTNSLVKSTLDVTNMNDSNFGNTTWYSGVYGILYRLQQVLADDDDIQMRKDTEQNRNSFKQNFLDSSSDNSVKVSDISSLSSLFTDFKNIFNPDIPPSALFLFLVDKDVTGPLDWFTPLCYYNMNTVPESSSYALRARSSSSCIDYVTPRMNDYYNAIEELK